MQIAHARLGSDSNWSAPLPTALDGPNTLVLAFASRAHFEQPSIWHALAQAFPQSVLMGCSSAGEIAGHAISDGTLSLAVARFERTRLHRASAQLDGLTDSFDAGARLAAELPQSGLRAVFVLCSGVDVNGAALIRGVAAALPGDVAVSGGLAGDGSQFEQTWVCGSAGPRQRLVTAVGLYGDALRVGYGCSGGWSEFGPERRVTRAQGNVLYELDAGPALALYKHYLGELAAQLPGSALLFPLALLPDRQGAAPLVRTILAIDEAQQSMTFAGDIPLGSAVRLMRTNVDRLVSSAEQAASQAVASLGCGDDATVLAVSVSCVGRRLVMGERTEEEVDAVAEQLPSGAAHVGFYSYGEISPARGLAGAELHNQTMTLTVFSEV